MSRILVIDDEPNIRLVYNEALTDGGHEVLEAESGAEGMALMEQYSLDLVVLDIKLKSESGLDVLQRISSQYPDLPVVLCSAYASFQDDYTTWLAERYVVKSGDPEELLRTVNEVLEQKRHQTSDLKHQTKTQSEV
jgi:DNA-binding NtrC family response regulator